MQLIDRSPSLKIFLDVDDLNNIHILEENVAKSQNFVLLLTEGALSRQFVQVFVVLAKMLILQAGMQSCIKE